MEFIYLIFYASLRLRFLDVETNTGRRRPVPAVCRMLCSNVRGLSGNLSDLTVAVSQYDILFCSETLVSDMRHVLELLVPGFGRPVLLCRGKMPRASGITKYFANTNLSVVVAKCCFLRFVEWDRTFMCSLYRNPDLDDRIFDCLLASMAAVQAEDVRASFLFVGDLNGHHQEW